MLDQRADFPCWCLRGMRECDLQLAAGIQKKRKVPMQSSLRLLIKIRRTCCGLPRESEIHGDIRAFAAIFLHTVSAAYKSTLTLQSSLVYFLPTSFCLSDNFLCMTDSELPFSYACSSPWRKPGCIASSHAFGFCRAGPSE